MIKSDTFGVTACKAPVLAGRSAKEASPQQQHHQLSETANPHPKFEFDMRVLSNAT